LLLGGSQINAIDLAAEIDRAGHNAILSGRALVNELKYHLPGNKPRQAAERQRKVQANVSASLSRLVTA
jgi:hypothetical protein